MACVLEISGGFETKRGVTWYGDEGWIWVDRSGIDAHPRSILMNKIRPDELRFERSTNHHRQFLRMRQDAAPDARAAGCRAAFGYPGLSGPDLDSDQHEDSVGPGRSNGF